MANSPRPAKRRGSPYGAAMPRKSVGPPRAPTSEMVAARILNNATACPVKRFDSADYFLDQHKHKRPSDDELVDATAAMDVTPSRPAPDAALDDSLQRPPPPSSLAALSLGLQRVDSMDLFDAHQELSKLSPQEDAAASYAASPLSLLGQPLEARLARRSSSPAA